MHSHQLDKYQPQKKENMLSLLTQIHYFLPGLMVTSISTGQLPKRLGTQAEVN